MEKLKRNSSYELLRIIAMLMIIVFHMYCLCINPQLNNGLCLEFNKPILYKRLILLQLISPMGKIGDSIFILISGYFMAHKNSSEINLFNISKKLLTQLFYSVVILTIITTILFKVFNFYNFDIDFRFEDITSFNYSEHWFLGYYFLIIFFGKLFFNKFLSTLDKEKYAELLIAGFAIITFTWTNSMMTDISSRLSTEVGGYFYTL